MESIAISQWLAGMLPEREATNDLLDDSGEHPVAEMSDFSETKESIKALPTNKLRSFFERFF